MENKNKKIVFGVTAVFFAIVTVCSYIFGSELCEIFSVPGFSAKIEMAKLIGPVATAFSAYLAIN